MTLAGVAYSAASTVAVKTAGVVTISAGTKTYALNISVATVRETNFALTSATDGGTVLGLSGALGAVVKGMQFIAPPAARAPMTQEDYAPVAEMAYRRGGMQDDVPHATSAHFAGVVTDVLAVPRGGVEMFAGLRAGFGVLTG